MKVQESFVITASRERLWAFLEQVDQVAQCVPGVDTVEQIDADNSKVRVTQAVGPMTATFDIKMRVTEREPLELMRFTTVGRAVKGAVGNVRATNTVRLSDVAEGTRVDVEADLAMGGVLGSVGQKVVTKQVGQVTRAFAAALERSIKGEAPLAATAAVAPARASRRARNGTAPAPEVGAAAARAAAAAPAPLDGAPVSAWQRPEILTALITLLAAVLGFAAGRSTRR
ncbi:MAG TPA: SRPBCC domain-containing protein [Baekduia sp.]|uniref:CoxG family protein n=1 Tax=Baekduia sp. TaxID=2600305 RepID=UPI002D01FE57|nr:SRPBCC domain-containing protein [Baekduia sp.]HMJ33507.1 SRPBCC domain-containing protein [Baekduia sp.]